MRRACGFDGEPCRVVALSYGVRYVFYKLYEFTLALVFLHVTIAVNNIEQDAKTFLLHQFTTH